MTKERDTKGGKAAANKPGTGDAARKGQAAGKGQGAGKEKGGK